MFVYLCSVSIEECRQNEENVSTAPAVWVREDSSCPQPRIKDAKITGSILEKPVAIPLLDPLANNKYNTNYKALVPYELSCIQWQQSRQSSQEAFVHEHIVKEVHAWFSHHLVLHASRRANRLPFNNYLGDGFRCDEIEDVFVQSRILFQY